MSLLLVQLPNSHHLEGGKEVSSSKHAETQGPGERSHIHSLPSLISWGHLLGGAGDEGVYFYLFRFLSFCWGGRRRINNFLKSGALCLLKIQPLRSLGAKLSVREEAIENLNYFKPNTNLLHFS